MVLRTASLSLLLAIAAADATAQNVAYAAEIGTINALFAGSVQVKVDRKQQLVMDLYDGNGRFRQDVVLLEHMDPEKIHFSSEEDAVVMGCITDRPQCFSKELFKQSTIRLSGRSHLPRPPEDTDGERTIAALRALIVAAQQQLAEAHETRQGRERMK